MKLNLKLGQYRVLYTVGLTPVGWEVTRWIKYASEWEDQTIVAEQIIDRRKAKRQMHRDQRSLRASGIYR